jgi:hypothetical protein
MCKDKGASITQANHPNNLIQNLISLGIGSMGSYSVFPWKRSDAYVEE